MAPHNCVALSHGPLLSRRDGGAGLTSSSSPIARRSPPVTKSARLRRLPPRVDHLAASGRATLVCPPDGPTAAPATRPEASAPPAAAHGIRSTRTESLRFCQNFQNKWVYRGRRERAGEPFGAFLALLAPSWPARTIVLLVRLTASRST